MYYKYTRFCMQPIASTKKQIGINTWMVECFTLLRIKKKHVNYPMVTITNCYFSKGPIHPLQSPQPDHLPRGHHPRASTMQVQFFGIQCHSSYSTWDKHIGKPGQTISRGEEKHGERSKWECREAFSFQVMLQKQRGNISIANCYNGLRGFIQVPPLMLSMSLIVQSS